jgi:ATP-dependent DNA helicase HFM1/MER3
MTKTEHRVRYQNLASGRKAVESHLHRCVPEFLNADIAQRVVTSVSQAREWVQKSLFWVRVFQNPTQYGFTAVGITAQAIAQQAMHLFVDVPLQKLQESGLIDINGSDGFITPKDPSSLMCKHCIQLTTMTMINKAPAATSPRDLLEV